MIKTFPRAGLPLAFLVALVVPLALFAAPTAQPLDVAGYLGFSYGDVVKEEPTARQNENKLWWHDGRWWAILYNDVTDTDQIYWLDLATHGWIDTGVPVDERGQARSDVLWDEEAGKLYVASHIKVENPTPATNEELWARLYRFSYNAGSRTYTLDGGYPVTINRERTETLVIDKDSTGRLWITFVSRETSQSTDYQVYVNATTGEDHLWGTPFPLPYAGATVDVDDISSLIAFTDNSGPKIGVMWSNQIDDNFYFATHDDTAPPGGGWTLDPPGLGVGYPADDHISLGKTQAGQVFAVVKAETVTPGDVLIGVVARDRDGSYSFHPTSPVGSVDTRPALAVHEQQGRVYVFTVSKTAGGQICMSSAAITSPLSVMAFPYENCPTPVDVEPPEGLELFISSSGYSNINNPTTAKHSATFASGIVVLASDDTNGRVYVHNHLDTQLPYNLFLPAVRR